MTKRMLVDAAYPEETRVVVADEDTLLDFDFETTGKRQLKGNIYLAKIVRVEPSLQAAFVEYGGSRHGFLAFGEIHPDYYQVPQADRERLADLEAQLVQAGADEDDEGDADEELDDGAETQTLNADAEATEGLAKLRRERARLLRSYKIQEVVRRRQIMLVQVMKEERGTKGAALTTYLSLAGRYCVLMPNTPKGGGISRKIATAGDRSRLRKIAGELDVPAGMGLIIRTAGQERTKVEIRRDYEYLLRLWSDIRERTLVSVAPCPIYEEADLIRRAMRDLYTSDIEEVLVEGEAGYKTAKAFMTMLMPSRARRVKQYKADTPLFFAFKVEDQLDKMHSATVQLRSGGSIVIHTSEALTAVDVNSGRATRERHIDETAVKTNLEAADEIARQMRLRDIAGLIVIDFIDMAEHRHQRHVEKRLRDALKIDRARLQVGRISSFGLLELSRQRLRPSFLELSTQPCPVCHGTGFIRSVESAALQALRRVESLGVEQKASKVGVTLPVNIALYVLNQKRHEVQRIEERYGLSLMVHVDDALVASELRVDILETAPSEPADVAADAEAVADAPLEAADAEAREEQAESAGEDGARRRRRRRRRPRRRGESETTDAAAGVEVEAETIDSEPAVLDGGEADEEAPAASEPVAASDEAAPFDDEPVKPKRRRRRRKPAGEPDAVSADALEPGSRVPEQTDLILPEMPDVPPLPEVIDEALAPVEVVAVEETVTTAAGSGGNGLDVEALEVAAAEQPGVDEAADEPRAAEPPVEEPDAPEPVVVVQAPETNAPKRQGWWSRWTKGGA